MECLNCNGVGDIIDVKYDIHNNQYLGMDICKKCSGTGEIKINEEEEEDE